MGLYLYVLTVVVNLTRGLVEWTGFVHIILHLVDINSLDNDGAY